MKKSGGGEQFVVQLSLSESTDFDELIDVENRLTLSFLNDRAAAVDGHALGDKTFNIFIVPRAAPEAVTARIKASLAESGLLDEARIARRTNAHGPYSVVWPGDYTGIFKL